MFIKKNDNVIVRGGDDNTKGTTKVHRVLRVMPKTGQALVEGVNTVVKHIKPNRRNPKGGKLSKEMPVPVSKLMLYCPSCVKGVRVGRRLLADGGKERYCKKCGNGLGSLRKAKKSKS